MNCNIKKNKDKKQCISSDGFFQVIIPKDDNSKFKIKRKYYIKYLDDINKHFGGSTIKPITLGCWKNQENKFQCEPGFSIEVFRDFNSSKGMEKFTPIKKKIQLKKDYNFLRGIAKDAGKQFGQWFIPVIYHEIPDVVMVPGEFKEKLPKSMTGEQENADLFKKFI